MGDQKERDPRFDGLRIVLGMAGVMWVLEVIDQLADNRLDQYGIEPRDADGLIGVVAAPFLHGGFDHLYRQHRSVPGDGIRDRRAGSRPGSSP